MLICGPLVPRSYLYIPLTTALLENKIVQLASKDLQAHLAKLKAAYKFLKRGVCIAINPCTHEYLCVAVFQLECGVYDAPYTHSSMNLFAHAFLAGLPSMASICRPLACPESPWASRALRFASH